VTVADVKPAPAQSAALDHTSIAASAGSGKTFQLTTRYLQLIVNGADPATIFASTFTRLAAGQIRDRILSRLAAAAGDDIERIELAHELGLDALPRSAILDLLAGLVRRMHLMQVRTLDSFFASVVRSFAIELNMPLAVEVVDDTQASAMRREAMRLMLDEHQPQALVELLRLLVRGASERNITGTIDRVVSDLYGLYLEAPPEAWECVPQPPGRLSFSHLAEAIAALEACEVPNDPKHLYAAWVKDRRHARGHDWSLFLGTGIARCVIEGRTTYRQAAIEAPLLEVYEPLVKHAIAELVGRVRDQTIATRDLLGAFDRQYERIKRRRRAVTFGDLALAVGRAKSLGTFDDIGFRLDAKLRHVLLDEFQDTSIPQWRALEPVIGEVISVRPPERTFFCVGDVKQSIYNWRDAAPEVLEQLPRLLSGADGSSAITQRQLWKSHRSSPVIMEAVNRVFEHLAGNPALEGNEDAAEAWSRSFRHHETEKRELPGCAELRLCRRAAANENAGHVRLRQAAELAAELHGRNRSISIALLTRINESVRRLAYEFGPTRLNLPAGTRGGGPLTDAAPVNVILDLLQLADHPDDTIAAFHVVSSPAGAMVGLERHEDARQRRRVARQIRARLLDDGYGRTIGTWVANLAGSCDARELRRLRHLVELADQHDLHPSHRTRDFIAQVEEQKVADAHPAPIQVMTIHQSKGLEFDAVILPDLEGRLAGNRPPVAAFERAGQTGTGPITRICRSMRSDLVDLVPDLKPLFERQRRRCVRESLSLLYVAMTRAKGGLYILLDPPAINCDGSPSRHSVKTLGGVAKGALAPAALEPDTIAFSIGEPSWTQTLPIEAGPPIDEAPQLERIDLAGGVEAVQRGSPRGLAGRAPSRAQRGTLAAELHQPDLEARLRGSATHTLFQQIEWLEEFSVPDAALAAIVRRAAPRRDQAWAAKQVAAFRRMLDSPAVRQALSRGARPASSLRVFREHPFATLVDGRVQTGLIDRLVVELDSAAPAGRPLRAMVIDFKTDQIGSSADAVAAHVEAYRPQMEAYQAAAADLLGINRDSVMMQLLFCAVGIVADCERMRPEDVSTRRFETLLPFPPTSSDVSPS
jgi:ATP-dependent exoDNAse (exonuclease V) beta subunit